MTASQQEPGDPMDRLDASGDITLRQWAEQQAAWWDDGNIVDAENLRSLLADASRLHQVEEALREAEREWGTALEQIAKGRETFHETWTDADVLATLVNIAGVAITVLPLSTKDTKPQEPIQPWPEGLPRGSLNAAAIDTEETALD